jgi:hypothetical protein
MTRLINQRQIETTEGTYRVYEFVVNGAYRIILRSPYGNRIASHTTTDSVAAYNVFSALH